MMVSSVFNILASYQHVTRNDPSFRAMVYGFYRIIAGRHEDPIRLSEIQAEGPQSKNLIQSSEPDNHIGVYDLATLGVPWLIEAFLRGNWIRWKALRATLRFLTDYVVSLLILVRAVLSAIVTIIALPILAVVHYLTGGVKS
jgi:hypothetical protein